MILIINLSTKFSTPHSQGHKKNASTFKGKEFGLFLQTSKRFLKSSRASEKEVREA